MDDSKPNQQTPPPTPNPTEGNQPPAPEIKGKDGAPNDETVTISKKELEGLRKSNKDLLSARDRNVESARRSEAFVDQLVQERYIDKFLVDNKDKYPDLTRDDLMYVDDPEYLEQEATRMQNRISEAAQKRLEAIQNPQPPVLSPEDKAEKLKELKKDKGGRNRFQRFLQIQQS